jgi:hypothetical protein
MTTKTNKILNRVVAITIILAVIVLVYGNLPKQIDSYSENNNTRKMTSESISLSLVFSCTYDERYQRTY